MSESASPSTTSDAGEISVLTAKGVRERHKTREYSRL